MNWPRNSPARVRSADRRRRRWDQHGGVAPFGKRRPGPELARRSRHIRGSGTLYERIRSAGRALDAIAINAGVGVSGPFADSDLREQMNLIELSVISPVHLTRRVIQDMLARRAGRILFTSSIAA